MPAMGGCVCRWWGRMRFFGLCSAVWLALAFVWISDAPRYSSSLGVSFPLAGGWFPRDMGIAGADSVSEPNLRRVWRKKPCHLTTAGQCLHLSLVAVFLARASRVCLAPSLPLWCSVHRFCRGQGTWQMGLLGYQIHSRSILIATEGIAF